MTDVPMSEAGQPAGPSAQSHAPHSMPPATPMKEHAPATEESRKLPFDQLCNLLNADEDTQTQGWALMQRVLRAVSVTPEQERFFFAAALCTSP